MKWETAISTVHDGKTVIRDAALVALARDHSFVGNVYFVLTGKTATPAIERTLNVLFSVSLDHGLGAVSTTAARMAASTGASLQQSLIAALASMGSAHGGATEDAARWFKERVANATPAADAVAAMLRDKKKIPGYGHCILQHDERTKLLFQVAKDNALFGNHCQYALEVESEILTQKGRAIPLNIDGSIAAVALDVGFSPDITTGIFIFGRLPGLLAHIQEEREQDNGLRRMSEDEITFRTGAS